MKRRLHTLRRAIADDSGVIGPAVAMLLIVVLIGAGLVFDGLREYPARAATLDFLDAAGVARTDVVSITVTATTVTVVLTARRDAVFGQLIGNDSIVVRGSGEATATFGNSP